MDYTKSVDTILSEIENDYYNLDPTIDTSIGSVIGIQNRAIAALHSNLCYIMDKIATNIIPNINMDEASLKQWAAITGVSIVPGQSLEILLQRIIAKISKIPNGVNKTSFEELVYSYGQYAHGDIWIAETAYNKYQIVKPTTNNGHLYISSNAGTTGASEPTWGTGYESETVDNDIVWVEYYDANTYYETVNKTFLYSNNSGAGIIDIVVRGNPRYSVATPTVERLKYAEIISNNLLNTLTSSIRTYGAIALPEVQVKNETKKETTISVIVPYGTPSSKLLSIKNQIISIMRSRNCGETLFLNDIQSILINSKVSFYELNITANINANPQPGYEALYERIYPYTDHDGTCLVTVVVES